MHIIVVGAGVTGIACAHNFLKRGHNVTLIEKASTPNQECSFGMAGFMGPISVHMLCAPFKGKAGLASIFAKTRRLGWDVSVPTDEIQTFRRNCPLPTLILYRVFEMLISPWKSIII